VFDVASAPRAGDHPSELGRGSGLRRGPICGLSKTITLWPKPEAGKKASGGSEAADLLRETRANLINHPNFALPNGNLSSALFGQTTALVGGGQGGARRLDLQVRFDLLGIHLSSGG